MSIIIFVCNGRQLCRDHPDALDLILKMCSSVNVVNFKLFTALHIAAHKSSVRCIEVLLRHNANVNAQVD